MYRVAATRVLYDKAVAGASKEQRYLLQLLEDGVDPHGSGRSVYFSYGYDLTLSAQRGFAAAAAAADGNAALRDAPPCERSDPRFFWNGVLARPVIDAGGCRFVVPMMLGFFGQLTDVQFGHGSKVASGSLTLLARRSMRRLGTRHWRRGADRRGNVANFAETEQLLELSVDSAGGGSGDNDGGTVLLSHVQVRGSIPLLWTQIPDIKYKPPTKIAPKADNGPVFDAHVGELLAAYQRVVAVNLVNQHGSEGRLEAAFRSESERFCAAAARGADGQACGYRCGD